MPIVFVHGVNVRKGPGYNAKVLTIQKFLEKHLRGATVGGKVLNTVAPDFPYWGGLATTFAWDMASLPSGDIDALGTPGVDPELRPLVALISDALADPQSARDEPLTVLAKESLPLAVDLITRLLLQDAKDADAEHIASFVVALQSYAEADTAPAWLAGIKTDAQLTNRLAQEIKAGEPAGTPMEALGTFDFITKPLAEGASKLKHAVQAAAGTVLDRTGDFASTKLLGWTRAPLNAVLGRFFGDVFIYLDSRGESAAPGPIPELVIEAVDRAVAAGPAGEPLIIIGHSLGGVICYDVISHFRPDWQVDLFVAVGSQVPHFEEMKRFKSSDPAIPNAGQKLAATSRGIKRWINIFDVVDIFSYSAKRIFDRVEDFGYDTKTYTIKAHGAYFEQDRFYTRLRDRIDHPI
jgi:hypothetical protein